jgi:hypothetical protein
MRPIRGAALAASVVIALVPGLACSGGSSGDDATSAPATANETPAAERYAELTAALNRELAGGLDGFDDALRAGDPEAAAAEMERLAAAYGGFTEGLGASEWPPAAAADVEEVFDLAVDAADLAEAIGADVADDGEALASDVAALRATARRVRAASAEARAALGLPPPPDEAPDP